MTVHPAADQAGPVGRVEGVTGGAASSHRRVARATVIVAIATGLVSLLGFLKDVVLVRELVGEAGDIDDPSMKDEDVFRFCRNEIVRCLEGGLDRLVARLEV